MAQPREYVILGEVEPAPSAGGDTTYGIVARVEAKDAEEAVLSLSKEGNFRAIPARFFDRVFPVEIQTVIKSFLIGASMLAVAL